MHSGDDKVSSGDDKVTSGDDKVHSGENKVTSGDDKVSSGDDKVTSGDDKVTSGDDKVSSGDDKVHSGENKVTSGDDMVHSVEKKVHSEEKKMHPGKDKVHSGVYKVQCSRYRNNHSLDDDRPRPSLANSTAVTSTRRKTSLAPLFYSPHTTRSGVRHVKVLRESIAAVPRLGQSPKSKSCWNDEQEHCIHDEDDLQQMNEVIALKEEITDLKQLLHTSNQQINKMKVREKEIKECSKDQIYELQQKNSELRKLINQNDIKHKQEQQHEECSRRRMEESSRIIKNQEMENAKLKALLLQSIDISKTTEMEILKLRSVISQLTKNRDDLQQRVVELLKENEHLQREHLQQKHTLENMSTETQHDELDSLAVEYVNLERKEAELQSNLKETETREETIRAELTVEKLKYKQELLRLQQTNVNKDPSVKEMITENKTNQLEKNYNREKGELDDSRTRYSEEMARTKQEIDDLKSKFAYTEMKMTTEKQERLNFLENEMQRRDKETTQLQRTITSLEQQIDHLRQENEKYKIDIDRQKQLHKRKSSDAFSNLRDTKTRLQTLSDEHERKLVEMFELRSRLRELEQTSKKAYEKVNRQEKENASLASELSDLSKRIKDITAENDALKSNFKEASSRMSKCMGGDELTKNNPNIVYLSDMNRPSKLADRYMELYDNQWTDAYELLEKSAGAEEQIIQILLETLIETKRFCDHHTEMEMNHILKVITRKDTWQQSEVPVRVIQYIKDRRKSTVAETMKTKYKEYVDDLRKSQTSFVKHALRIDAYLQECFEVCWLMAIQDPPVVLAPVSKQGDIFKADLYSAYTVTGKTVDYVVWPALLLHTNGPTLTKGVAQGMKKR